MSNPSIGIRKELNRSFDRVYEWEASDSPNHNVVHYMEADALEPSNWPGLNLLGQALMTIRDELQNR